MNIQNYTYHTHNNEMRFDGHNSAEEMITKAEELGFEAIGVSNHLICYPRIFRSDVEPMFFTDFDKALDCYKRHIDILREAQNRHRIKIYVGFETDYFDSPQWRDNFEKMRRQLDVDYLIGSTHVLRTPDLTQVYNIYHLHYLPALPQRAEYQELLRSYWQNIVRCIESGYFDFIAHIDYADIFNLYDAPEWDEYRWQVIETLDKCKQPYELNTSGFNRIGRQHPATWMLEELNKRDIPVVISDDAHGVEMIGQHFEKAEQLLADIGYKKRFKLPEKI